MKITRIIKDEQELFSTLCQLSKEHNGAWVFSIKPFSHEVEFFQFKNPSSVPDHFFDLTRDAMGWKGKVRGFSKAARRREQNRGLGKA